MSVLRWLVIIVYLALAAAPLLWLGVTSLQTQEQSLSTTAGAFTPTFDALRPTSARVDTGSAL